MTWCIVDAVNLLRTRVKVSSIKATNLLRLKALFLMAAGALRTDNRPIYFYDLTAFYGDKTEWRFEIFRERQFPSFKSNTLHKYEKRPIRNFLCFTKNSDRHLKNICCRWKKFKKKDFRLYDIWCAQHLKSFEGMKFSFGNFPTMVSFRCALDQILFYCTLWQNAQQVAQNKSQKKVLGGADTKLKTKRNHYQSQCLP